MTTFLANASRRLQRAPNAFVAPYSTRPTSFKSLVQPKKTNAAALSVSSSSDQSEKLASLADDAAALAKQAKAFEKPDVRYTALRAGFAYSPFELKKGRMLEKKNFRRNKTPRMGPGAEEALRTDVIQHFGIVPQHEHINPLFLNGFLTDMGKIKGRNETRLSRKSQRMIGKAIRRARAIGTMPVMHKALTYTFETTSLSRPDSTTFV